MAKQAVDLTGTGKSLIIAQHQGDPPIGQRRDVVPLEIVTDAPVTYVPANKTHPIDTNKGPVVQTAGHGFRTFATATLGVVLGAVLLLGGGITGCSTMHANVNGVPAAVQRAPISAEQRALNEAVDDIPSDTARKVKSLIKDQTKAIKKSKTPGVGMVPGNGDADMVHNYHYKLHRSQRWTVSDLGESGLFALRAVGPESGHVSDGMNSGAIMAYHYSDIGAVEIQFRGPNGNSYSGEPLKLYREDGTEATEGYIRKDFDGKLSQTIGMVVELEKGVNKLYFSPFPVARGDLDCYQNTTTSSHGHTIHPHGSHNFRVDGEDAIRMIEIVWDGT